MKTSRLIPRLTLLLAMLASTPVLAFDFRTIGVPSAILYDAPSLRGSRLFVAPQGMPVQVVTAYGDWVKVRDASGDLAWLEAKALSARRNVVVRVASARVRSAPDDDAPLVMSADKGVLLELVDPQPGTWVRVRHRDGLAGYVRAAEIWGI
jgi:SH3-like domain-containing protein